MAVPFKVCTKRSDPSLVTEADVQPPSLVVGRVRAGGDLPVALLARDPGLDVVLLGGGRSEIAGGGDHDPVGDAEAGDDVLLDGEDLLVVVARTLREGEEEHLHLVELVHPEDAAGVAPGGAGFTPKAGGVARVAQRELVGGQDLALVQRRRGRPRRSRSGTARHL